MSKGNWLRRTTAAIALTALALTGTAGTALAHECYNDSRSATGDAKAAGSAAWMPLSEVFLTFVVVFELGFEPLTEEQMADAAALIAEQKASGDFDELYALDRSVLSSTTAMQGQGAYGTEKSSDDRAIDHATFNLDELDPLANHLIGIYFAVGGAGPA